MKILHTSDWHLGRNLYTKTRYAEHEAFLNWLVYCIEKEQVDALLVAGDIFDSATPSTKAQELYFSFLAKVATLPCCRDVIITGGNHDSPALLQAARAPLQALRIHVFATAPADPAQAILPLYDAQGCPTLLLCPVPFLRDKDVRVVNAGESLEDKSTKLVQGVTAYYQAVCAEAEKLRAGQNLPLVVMGHCFAAGGRISEGDGVRELYVGSLAHIPAAAFPTSIDYLALGHLHAPQIVAGKEHWRYSGTPLPMSFSEGEQKKSVCLVEFMGRTTQISTLPVPCWQTLRRIKGDKEQIVATIHQLCLNNEACWLEVEHTGQDLAANLHEELEAMVQGSAVEILRIKEQALSTKALALESTESLEELSIHDVFSRCLDSQDIAAAARPDLVHCFNEIAAAVGTEQASATAGGCLAALHSLRFANLNSLMGEWTIDFRHEAYRTDGIFAITGATGAGKSTLLDALCLALYGRTPRLEKITASSNAIMSRQASFCFAEVTFATSTGLYRAHFSQKRKTRGKNKDGLQEPKYEISLLPQGTVLATKAREAAACIENITGMDFERFSRAILLAQGDFATFLRAGADARAPLLEQITQTEIYTKLSQAVHERFNHEKDVLMPLEAQKDALQLTSEEELAAQNTALRCHKNALAALQDCSQTLEQRAQWQQKIQHLQEQCASLASEAANNAAAQQAFQPEKEKLAAAQRADAVQPAYNEALRLREQAQAQQQEASALHSLLATKAAQKEQQEAAAALALTQQEQAEHAWQINIPLFSQVRTLDALLEDKKAQLAQSQHKTTQQEAALLQAQEELASLHKQRITAEQDHRQANKAWQALAADAPLQEEYTGLAAKLEGLAALYAQQKKLLQAKEQAQAEKTQQAATLALLHSQLAAQQQHCDRQEHLLAEQEQTLHHLLAGKSTAQWHESLLALTQKQTLLNDAAQKVQVLLELQEAEQRQRERLGATDHALALQEQCLITAESEQQRHGAAFDHAVTQLRLVKTIQSLEAERAALQQGQPCPLCGALQHPYSHATALPQPAPAEQAIEACRSRMDAATHALQQAKQTLQTLQNQKANALAEQQRLHKEKETVLAQLAAAFPEYSAPSLPQTLQAQCALWQHKAEQEYAACRQMLTSIEQATQARDEQRQKQQEARDALVQSQAAAQQANTVLEQASQAEQRNSAEYAAISTQCMALQNTLLNCLDTYGIASLDAASIENIAHLLAQRKTNYAHTTEALTVAQRTYERLSNAHLVAQHTVQQKEKEYVVTQQHCASLLQEAAALGKQREALFGDGSVDDAEKTLQAQREQARAHYAAALGKATQATQAWSTTQALLKQKQQTCCQTTQAKDAAEATLLQALAQAQFAHESEYCSTCLAPETRQALCKRRDALAQEEHIVQEKIQATLQALHAEQARPYSSIPEKELHVLLEEVRELIQQQHESVGALQHAFAEQEQKQRASASLAAHIAAQKREVSLWADMHKLIGSADGKKFRNFAQALTFEHVVHLANRQLRTMTDRYILMRDPNLPLELHVIDVWQGGLSRTTKNLSGGESFLVSLALALALSRMVSKHGHVESLFLDEGFGTLDEETLNTALEALARLQKSGRLIGVISHIAALRDRIGTQIYVKRESGGKSSLHGPGCSGKGLV